MSNSHMTLRELHDRHLTLGKNDVVLDVRNRDEYAEVHIKGSLNFPLPELEQHVQELKKYDHVYIHCKRGGRAKTAFELLSKSGLTNLVCIHDAGMDMWVESGFPCERGNA
jgi:rhodanese-related sulfurtransferase